MFLACPCALSGVTHAPDPVNKENIVVSVGKLDVVNDAYLKALEPVVMKRMDPASKPKPGYVARAAPTKVGRGISISGGPVLQQQVAASAAASSTPARALPPPPAPKSADMWARAVEDFVGSDNRELTFRKGDVLRILSQDDSGWWSAEREGVLGYAPSTYLEVMDAPPVQQRRGSMHTAPLPAKR